MESHDWDARADRAPVEARTLPEGPERAEVMRKISELRAAAHMKRALSRSQS